jgi:hypothetical protein
MLLEAIRITMGGKNTNILICDFRRVIFVFYVFINKSPDVIEMRGSSQYVILRKYPLFKPVLV